MDVKKFISTTIQILVFIALVPAFSNAAVIEYDAGTYTQPDNYKTIFSLDDVRLPHDIYYILRLRDFDHEIAALNIIFHDIANWRVEENWLNVYLFDEPSSRFDWHWGGNDATSLDAPDWEGYYGATCIGTWSYVTETKDVVFSTADPTLLAYLTGGIDFAIGIDPDCYFTTSSISVEVPVPEPTTLLLLGTGLLGLAGFRKRQK